MTAEPGRHQRVQRVMVLVAQANHYRERVATGNPRDILQHLRVAVPGQDEQGFEVAR